MYIVKNQLPSVLRALMCGEGSECPELYDDDIPFYFNGNIMVVIVVCAIVVPLASLKSIEFLGTFSYKRPLT